MFVICEGAGSAESVACREGWILHTGNILANATHLQGHRMKQNGGSAVHHVGKHAG